MPHVPGQSSKKLSLQAREILYAARVRGAVFLLRSTGKTKWVASGPHHLKGFQELQSKGLLVHDFGNHYRLAIKPSEVREWLEH